jgi:hypothetical protein
MKTILLTLALAVSASAQIEGLLKKGANVTLKDQAILFVPVKFEACDVAWQIKYNNVITREVTISLGDLDPERVRIEPLKDEPGILQLMLYTANSRELIKEQTIHRDNSRTDATHKSVHVVLIKGRSNADKLSQAFRSASGKFVNRSPDSD